jgi:hypothetical protein
LITTALAAPSDCPCSGLCPILCSHRVLSCKEVESSRAVALYFVDRDLACFRDAPAHTATQNGYRGRPLGTRKTLATPGALTWTWQSLCGGFGTEAVKSFALRSAAQGGTSIWSNTSPVGAWPCFKPTQRISYAVGPVSMQ